MITDKDVEKVFDKPSLSWKFLETGILFTKLLKERDAYRKVAHDHHKEHSSVDSLPYPSDAAYLDVDDEAKWIFSREENK